MPETAEVEDVTVDQRLVLVEDHGNWALLTINRPEKRNAMSIAARARLRQALAEVRTKRVVVLTGAGASFCAGVDLVELRDRLDEPNFVDEIFGDSWSECNEDIRLHPAIFIAAVNGYALGGGSTLINNCELAVAAESATIGTPELGFGTWPGLAGPAMLSRILPKHAAEIILLSKRVDAQTAHRMGIVNEVVPDDQLLSRATELADTIAGFDPVALKWAKKAIRRMVSMSWEESQELSRYISSVIALSRPDEAEGFTLNDFARGGRSKGQGR